MEMKSTHTSNLGRTAPTHITDGEGYISYRDGYESLPESEWTDAERWLHAAEESIERFQRG